MATLLRDAATVCGWRPCSLPLALRFCLLLPAAAGIQSAVSLSIFWWFHAAAVFAPLRPHTFIDKRYVSLVPPFDGKTT